MSRLQRVAFIGNHLPRRCGIATFTHDLHRAISIAGPDLDTGVVVMTDPGHSYDYPGEVLLQIHDDAIHEYIEAADFLNDGQYDVVCLQHEYGIFEISSSFYRGSQCRLSPHFTPFWPSRPLNRQS